MNARLDTALPAETELLDSLEARRARGHAYVQWGRNEIRSAEAGLWAIRSAVRESREQDSLLAGLAHRTGRKRLRIWSEADLREGEEAEDEDDEPEDQDDDDQDDNDDQDHNDDQDDNDDRSRPGNIGRGGQG